MSVSGILERFLSIQWSASDLVGAVGGILNSQDI